MILQEAFQSGMAVKLITKIARVVERRIKKEVTISSFPVEYKNEFGIFQGFYGITGYGRVFRINFLRNSSDTLYSLDLYKEAMNHPFVTVDLYGFNIIQCIEILAEELDGIKVDKTLTESSKYGKRVEARLLEYTSDDRKQSLFKAWLNEEPTSLDLLQNKRLAEVYTLFIKKDKKYNGEVNFPSFQTLAKQYLFSMGLTNPSFRNRKKGSRVEREIVDKAKEDQLQDIVASMEVNKKFEFLASAVEAVVDNRIQAVICYGSPGSGKTKTVMDTLDRLKVTPQVFSGGFKNTDELFKILIKYNKGSLLIFDDCDSVFKNIDNRNLLKSALSNSGDRVITWRDKKLDFDSGVIFISNLSKFDPAIASRSMNIEITLSNEQMLARMEDNLKAFMPEVDMKSKKMALEFLKEIQGGVLTVDFRELQKCIISLQLRPNDWKDFALLMLTSQ